MSSANAPYITRDLAHVWHPCTQMKDHEAELPLIPDPPRGRGVARGLRGQALPGCGELLVGEPLRARPPEDQCGGARAAGVPRAGDPRRLHARAGDRPLRGARSARPPGAYALFLRRQRLLGGGSGREDELPLLAQRRPHRKTPLHHPRQQLPRGDPGCARGRQRRAVQRDLPPAAHGRDHRSPPRTATTARRG